MKRAQLRGLTRNSAVVLGNVATNDDVSRLDAALQDHEPIAREHVAWARARIMARPD